MRASFLPALVVAFPLRAELPVKSYAQELVDRTVAKNPELLVIALHATPPSYPIIASNIGRIGKPADEDDMRVVNSEKTNLEVAHSGTRFEVELVLRDLSGANIGALGLVFPYQQGDSKAALEKKAVRIRDALAKRILDAASLVEPFPFDALATTKTHAQKLVDRMLEKHAELNMLALRVKPPKGSDAVMIASNFGGIGKKAGEAEAQANGKRREIPLLDVAGNTIGALGVGWPGEKPVAEAEKIRDELRKQIPSIEKLVELDP